MVLVTTLHSGRSKEIDEEEAHRARASVPRKARHARDPADDPAQERSRPRQGPGAGLADTCPDERAHGAPSPAAKARLWPCRSQRGSAADERGQTGEDQLRLAHQDEPLSRGEGGTAAELLGVGAVASLSEVRAHGAKARTGCAGTAPSIPGRPGPGPHGWLAARITGLSSKPRRQELVRSRRAARGGLAQPVAVQSLTAGR